MIAGPHTTSQTAQPAYQMALVCSKEHTLLDGIIAWGQLVILCRGAAPQRIHTSFKKATSKGLSVRGYAPISSPVASLSEKVSAVSAVGRKRYRISEGSAIFLSIEAVTRKTFYWSERDKRCVNIATKYVLFTAVFEGAVAHYRGCRWANAIYILCGVVNIILKRINSHRFPSDETKLWYILYSVKMSESSIVARFHINIKL